MAPKGTTTVPMFNAQVAIELPHRFGSWFDRLQRLAWRFPRPRLVVHYSHPFDLHVSQKFLRELHKQPDWFQRRTVVACFESNLRDDVARRVPGLSATLLSLPHTTSAWTRPPSLAVSSASARSNHVLFAGTQRRGAATRVRQRIVADMLQAGGACVGNRCVVGKRRQTAASLGARLRTRGRTPWEDVLVSDFCLQPPGDVLTRSHFYLSVQAGCVPVTFEGARPDYLSTSATAWAWRDVLPFDSFAVSIQRGDETSVIHRLNEITRLRLHAMRRALDRYANLTMYGDGSFADAFSMLQFWLRCA